MYKQWNQKEKIEILEKTKNLSLRKAAKISKVHYTTIDRWRKDYHKNGIKGLQRGNGEHCRKSTKKYIENMKKPELILLLKESKHLDLLSKNSSKKEKFKKINFLNKEKEFPIKKLCDLADVSRAGFYKWRKNGQQENNKWNSDLAKLIKDVYYFYNRVYGYKMLTLFLNKMDENLKLTFGKVYRYTKKLGLLALHRKRKPKYPTSGKLRYDNKLNRNFSANYYGQKIVTDITYLHYNTSTMYLSVVKDLWSGQIIDFQISDNLYFDFVEENLKMAKSKIGLNVKSIIHSDQGWHYTIKKYLLLCQNLNLEISMSRRGNSPDNGACETFFATLKSEAIYLKSRSKWKKDEMIQTVNEYIEFYNSYRPRLNYQNLSPNEFINKNSNYQSC